MGGAKLIVSEQQQLCVPPASRGSQLELCMSEQYFTDETISIESNTYQYKDCEASCIGTGSFGCVFRGTSVSTGSAIAIKKMAKMSVKPNELKVMKAVRSDFLVGLIDVCMQHEDSMFIIMELCDIDLDRHLKYHTIDGALSTSDLRLLIDNVARGYNALYKNCIVHRDIKPPNILIKYGGPFGQNFETAKISDFGISRILSDEEDEALSNVAGTLYYMAPEVGANILRTCEYGHEVDMWSLGCVFYQCLIGQIPFDECALCRMFLFVAGDNFDAYDMPELPDGSEQKFVTLIRAMLEIDCTKRITPQQFYQVVRTWSNDGEWSCGGDSSSCKSGSSCSSITDPAALTTVV